MPEYTLKDLMVAKQIAELLMDRTIDSKILKRINQQIAQTRNGQKV